MKCGREKAATVMKCRPRAVGSYLDEYLHVSGVGHER
jgi:hypothetical protein